MDARKSPRDTLHWECGDTYIDNWHKYTEYKKKNRVDAGTAVVTQVVTQPKTFEVKGDSAVLILYPSKIEADSLIMLWGEDWFLSVKYYENYKLSLIRDLLNDKNVSCQTTDNRIIHFVESEIYFDKITMDDAWCVITCDKGKIIRQNTDDYLEANMYSTEWNTK